MTVLQRCPVCAREDCCEHVPARITTLEDSAAFINDLANALPEHQDWLWRIADNLTTEAQTLKRTLAAFGSTA